MPPTDDEALAALRILRGWLTAPRPAYSADPPDSLVPIAGKPLSELGLELRAVQRLIAVGWLRVVAIGRRRFTKRSYLLALVDELRPVGPKARKDEPEKVDELAVAVALAAARRAKRAGGRKAPWPARQPSDVSDEIAREVRVPFRRKLR